MEQGNTQYGTPTAEQAKTALNLFTELDKDSKEWVQKLACISAQDKYRSGKQNRKIEELPLESIQEYYEVTTCKLSALAETLTHWNQSKANLRASKRAGKTFREVYDSWTTLSLKAPEHILQEQVETYSTLLAGMSELHWRNIVGREIRERMKAVKNQHSWAQIQAELFKYTNGTDTYLGIAPQAEAKIKKDTEKAYKRAQQAFGAGGVSGVTTAFSQARWALIRDSCVKPSTATKQLRQMVQWKDWPEVYEEAKSWLQSFIPDPSFDKPHVEDELALQAREQQELEEDLAKQLDSWVNEVEDITDVQQLVTITGKTHHTIETAGQLVAKAVALESTASSKQFLPQFTRGKEALESKLNELLKWEADQSKSLLYSHEEGRNILDHLKAKAQFEVSNLRSSHAQYLLRSSTEEDAVADKILQNLAKKTKEEHKRWHKRWQKAQTNVSELIKESSLEDLEGTHKDWLSRHLISSTEILHKVRKKCDQVCDKENGDTRSTTGETIDNLSVLWKRVHDLYYQKQSPTQDEFNSVLGAARERVKRMEDTRKYLDSVHKKLMEDDTYPDFGTDPMNADGRTFPYPRIGSIMMENRTVPLDLDARSLRFEIERVERKWNCTDEDDTDASPPLEATQLSAQCDT